MIKVTIQGTRPLLMQSDRLVDPTDPISREKARAAKSKDKATDAGQGEIGRLEFLGSLYLDDDGEPCIPQDNILRALRDAAAREKLGKAVREQIVCNAEWFKLQYDGPRDPKKLFADRRFVFRKSVVNAGGNTRVMRTRPRFPAGWSLDIELSIEGHRTLTSEDVRRFFEIAGPLGIGTWRPRYGGFVVTKWSE